MTKTKRRTVQQVAGNVASATVVGTGKIVATAAVAGAVVTAVAMPLAKHLESRQQSQR